MKHLRTFLIYLLASGVLSGCQHIQDAGADGSIQADMLASPQWLENRLGSPVVILHVGPDLEQFESGHIPGATFVPWSSLNMMRDGIEGMLPPAVDLVETFSAAGVGDGLGVVIYDEIGGPQAARAWMALDYLGLSGQARLLDGHLPTWVAQHRPLATGAQPVQSATLDTVRLQTDRLVDLAVMMDLVAMNQKGAGQTMLIDARPPGEFCGSTPGTRIERPGHIPGAVNVFWMQSVASPDNPVLLAPAQLRRLYGLDDSVADRIVTYCRTGGQAAHAYFVLRYLGENPLLYDGSYIQWQSRDGLPVVHCRDD